jgi:hypothetical protein
MISTYARNMASIMHPRLDRRVGSVNRRHFHRPDCPWMRQVRYPQVTEFADREEALAEGRKPCKTCGS